MLYLVFTPRKWPIYANTNIAKLYKEVNNSESHNVVKLADFAPASFIDAPISDGFSKTGVLVLQIPIDQINSVMMGRSGLGETGETYLVGSDKLMRSDSRYKRYEMGNHS